jgi:thioredoxin
MEEENASRHAHSDGGHLMAGPIELTDAGFAAAIERGARLALVDFWAPWCGPCRAVAPVIDQLAEEYAGRLAVAKVNVDDNPVAAARFGIQSIPTLLLFRDGEKAVDKSRISA